MAAQTDEALLRSAMYEMLSLAFLYPEEASLPALRDAAPELSDGAAEAGWEVVPGMLRSLAEGLERADREMLESEYVAVFGHTISTDCAPYEGEYGQAHVFQKSQTLADLSTFYSAFDVQVSPDVRDRLDHISVEMEFMHLLTLKEAHGRANGHGDDRVLLCRQAQEAFLAQHLAGWVHAFSRRLAGKSPAGGIYAALARLLDAYMEMEFRRFELDSAPLDLSQSDEDAGQDEECGPLAVPGDAVEEAAAR